MSDEVYFNEPGFEHERGSIEGQGKDQGYVNIVRYCNIKYAMIQQLQHPHPGTEQIIRRHFLVNRSAVMAGCEAWIKSARENSAIYTGLVADHNA